MMMSEADKAEVRMKSKLDQKNSEMQEFAKICRRYYSALIKNDLFTREEAFNLFLYWYKLYWADYYDTIPEVILEEDEEEDSDSGEK